MVPPLPEPCDALFYDGQSAIEHNVTVDVAVDRMALEISGASLEVPLFWPLTDLRALSDRKDRDHITLSRHAVTEDESQRDLARLIIEDPDMVAWLHRSRPHLHATDLRPGWGKRLAIYASAAVAALGLMLFVILPAMANTLAQIIPIEREIALGRSVTAQLERVLGGREMGALRCEGQEGQAALERLADRLQQGRDLGYDLEIQVFDHPMVNAFAAPGGQVVLMRGLLAKAPGPDAVAAVLAHEIGHVVARDPTRIALRTVGSAGLLSLALGDVTGGVILVFVGEQMLNTSYSRAAEEAADAYALELLDGAEISAAGFGAFFEMMLGMGARVDIPELLSTHPDTENRAARARAFAEAQGPTRPAMSDADWAALKSICDD